MWNGPTDIAATMGCKIPGDMGVWTKEAEGETTDLCASETLRGAAGSCLRGWRERV